MRPHEERSSSVIGELKIGGHPAILKTCRPTSEPHAVVSVETSLGTLRFESQQLSWNGARLACAKLDRGWQGGKRPDGSSYWRGELDFRCHLGEQPVTGKLALDCGGISPQERVNLDRDRADLRQRQQDQQRRDQPAGSAAPAGSGSAVPSLEPGA